MNILIAGATGLIGRALTPVLQQDGHHITIVGRQLNKIIALFGNSVTPLLWEEVTLSTLRQCDIIINLAGYNISETRWSKAVKGTILTSRIATTQKLAELCADLGSASPRLFNASAVGIYGCHNINSTIPFTETSPIAWNKATDFLSEVGQRWEQSLQPAIDQNVAVTILRFGVVLSQEGGFLKKMLPLFRSNLGGIVGNGKQMLSWISIIDLIAIFRFLITQPTLKGCFNCVSPHPVTQKQFVTTLADVLHKSTWLRLPAWLVKSLLGQMGEELMLQGQAATPERLSNSGFVFQYPELKQALIKQLST